MKRATTLAWTAVEQALDALLETSSQRPVLSRRYAYIVKVDGKLLYIPEDQLFRVLEQAGAVVCGRQAGVDERLEERNEP